MESTSDPVFEASSDSFTSSSFPYSGIVEDASVLNTITDSIENNDDNRRTDSTKVTVSEDEGYVSGHEEFEQELNKPVLDEETSDVSAKIQSSPLSEVVASGDGGVGDDTEVDEKWGFCLDDSGKEAESETVESVEKFSDEGVIEGDEIVCGKVGNELLEDVEMKGLGNIKYSYVGDDEVSEPEVKDKLTATGDDVESMGKENSVVDTIQIDVAAPGVAIVGGTEKNGDVVNKPVEEVVVVEPEKLEVVTGGDFNGGDSIPVDMVAPGSTLAGEAGENGDVVVKAMEEVVPEMAVVEPEKLEVVSGADAKLTSEGDSIVDTIHVDLVVPGVAVVGEAEENGGEMTESNDIVENNVDVAGEADENGDVVVKAVEEVVSEVAVVEPEMLEVVSGADAKLTSEGDSIVDTIHVDIVVPGVAVVGEAEENGGEKIESNDIVENNVDIVHTNPFQPVSDVAGDEKYVNLVGEPQICVGNNGSVDISKNLDMEVETETIVNGFTTKTQTDGVVNQIVASERDVNQLDILNGEHSAVSAQDNELTDGVSEESMPMLDFEEIREVEDEMDEINPEDSDEETDGMIFGSSEAAKKFIEELERESGSDSHTRVLEQSHDIDGQIVMDSEEEEDGEETDNDDGDGKELFDSAALAALLKAATGGDSNGGSIRITSEDLPKLFSVERPAGLGSSLQSLRPAARSNLNRPSLFTNLTPGGGGGGESKDSLSEEDKKKLEKLQQIRVKFLRLVHRLGLSPEESVAAQVLYRLALLGGRQNTVSFSLDAAKRAALELETEGKDDLDFSVNILVLGKPGVGKSATINSVFGEEKAPIHAFETGTDSVKEMFGVVDGVKVRVVDTPGLKTSVAEQGVNRSILSSVKKLTKKSPPDVVLYVDRLDAQCRDLNDLPLLKTITSVLDSSIWRSAIVTLTHSASAPPDGPSGAPLSYEVFVSQRSHVVQQSIGHSVGDLRMMSPSLMNPVSLVENHPSCRKNRDGHKILPNGQIWRPQLLLLCYSMKILSEASLISKPQDPFDHRKLFGFRGRAPPLPYMLSSMLQSRAHPKLPSDQGGGENGDSDIDLDGFSDIDEEEEDEYDQLPPFKPLTKAKIAKLSREHQKAYFEEYDFRVKLLQKKQWREELRRMREFKKRGNNNNVTDYGFGDDEPDSGPAAPVSVPLPDMALPPSFDGDNPAYRYRFLEPTSQFLARPVLDTHGWDHDCGYDGVNLEHSLGILNRFPAMYTFQITKDKKDFTISLESSISAKHGDNISTMAGFDIQNMGKQLAYIFRGETKIKNLKRNKATGGVSFTILGENVVPALKIEDQITFGKRYTLVGSVGAVRSQQETAYGANFEMQRRENDFPIGQVQSTLSMSVIKWRGDLALGLNGLFQLSLGRNSKVAVRAGINNKMSGQVTVRTSSSENLLLALASVIPVAVSVYKKLFPALVEKYSIY